VTEPETPTAPDAAHDAKPAAEAPAPPRQTSMVPGPPPGIPVRPRGSAPVVVKLERFEGPLDLLLHLIKRDEIDIYDIPISRITQQYLAYLELMRALDLEVAGEFLVMAATLMRIKAKMLLPAPQADEEEEEGDPREELVQRLIEYRQFKEAASTLRVREEDRRRLYERGMLPSEDDAGPLPLAPASLFDLMDAFHRVIARIPEPAVYEVRAEVFDVEEKMTEIASAVAEDGTVMFSALLLRCRARAEMVVTFVALLELIKLGQVTVIQTEHFDDITIVHREPEGSPPHASVESQSGA
jgi:segregation and condensation protein A